MGLGLDITELWNRKKTRKFHPSSKLNRKSGPLDFCGIVLDLLEIIVNT
jgi:hypothetical protein